MTTHQDLTQRGRAPLFAEPKDRYEPFVRLPLSGPLLSAVGRLSTLPGVGAAVRVAVNEMLGIRALSRLPESFQGPLPDDLTPHRAREPRRWSDATLAPFEGGGWPHASGAYQRAYASGRARPEEVVERALTALSLLSRRTPSMNVLASCDPDALRDAARASAARIARGDARPLEGVPFLAKDQHDVAGLPTRFGSRHTPAVATSDATLITRLKAAGALVLGKSVMTEWGVSPIGTNVHVELPRNPHAPAHVTGGSSTGSAAAVALGIGPFATGGDAGGSIRIPASFCGVFGLKPTFGRVSRAGDAGSSSLNHLGVLAATVDDIARFLDAVASEADPADMFTAAAAPPPRGGFGARLGEGVRGLRIGIEEAEWADCSPEIAAAARAALCELEREGARLVPIRVPLARHTPALGVATIGCEGVALARTASADELAHLALDIRLAINVAAGVSAGDYLQVQRLRAGLRRQLAAALRNVDVIALPTVPIAPPRLPERAFHEPISDAALLLSLARHTFLANLTGVPAASAPVGFDRAGAPIGLQIVGDAWDEAGVLAVLAHLERVGVARVVAPRGAVNLLEPTRGA